MLIFPLICFTFFKAYESIQRPPYRCMTATLAPVSGNEDVVASCSLRCYGWRLPFLQQLQQEFEMGNYCLSCSFFLSLRDGIKHTDTLTVEITLRSASFHTVDPRFKVLTRLWPTFSSANRAEMVTKMRGN